MLKGGCRELRKAVSQNYLLEQAGHCNGNTPRGEYGESFKLATFELRNHFRMMY